MKVSNILPRWLSRKNFPLIAAGLGLLLTLPSLGVGLQIDDYLHRVMLLGDSEFGPFQTNPFDLFAFFDGDPQRNRELMDIGVLPWWTYENLHAAFWRPVSALTHWLDYQFWPNRPVLMHVQNLLWYALVIVTAGLLYRRLIGATWIAGLACLLFTIEDNHALSVGWIAGRNGTIACAFGLLCLLAHDRWRRDNWKPGALLAPAALLLALLAGESGLATCAYLFAHVCFLDRNQLRLRVVVLLPYVIIAVAWFVCYRALGYGVSGCGPYDDPASDPLGFLWLIVQRGPLLLMGQFAAPGADACSIVSALVLQVLWIWALVAVVLLAVTFTPLLRNSAEARFFATGAVLATIPLCTVFPMDRILFFVGFGAMGLVAVFLGKWSTGLDWVSPRLGRRMLTRLVAVGFIVIHGIIAPLALSVMSWLPAKFGDAVTRAAESLPTDSTLSGKQLIIASAPDAFSASYVPVLRSLAGQPLPTHTRIIAPAGQRTQLRRLDAYTLVVRPDLGFLPPAGTPTIDSRHPSLDMAYVHQRLNQLFRDQAHPMKLGERVVLTGMTIEITDLTVDGRPAEAAFRFAVQLEDPGLYWVRHRAGVYVPFTPPAIGKTVVLGTNDDTEF